MIINEAGEYTLQYTATDACGNTTVVNRELTVEEPPTYRTVLYTDGTFIINESSRDEAANVALHGAATNVYDPFDPNGATNMKKYIFSSNTQRPWNSQASSVISVEIGSNIQPTSTAYWFYGMTNCTSIDLTGLNTSAVTNMSNMFRDCRALTSLDVSNINTSAVTNMSNMFRDCRALTSLDVSNINTSAVTDMSSMFNNCQSLTSLDVSNFNTSNVTNMSSMFNNCQSLTSLDVSNFNTSNVTNMSSMFNNCQSLTSLDVSNINTSVVTSMGSMFQSCQSLTSLDLSNINTSAVTSMGSMFNDCRALISLDLSNFNTSIVTDMSSMFYYCRALTTIYASANFTVTQVTSSSNMFAGMTTNLVGGAGTVWNSGNPQDKTYAHIDGGTSDPGYFTARS